MFCLSNALPSPFCSELMFDERRIWVAEMTTSDSFDPMPDHEGNSDFVFHIFGLSPVTSTSVDCMKSSDRRVQLCPFRSFPVAMLGKPVFDVGRQSDVKARMLKLQDIEVNIYGFRGATPVNRSLIRLLLFTKPNELFTGLVGYLLADNAFLPSLNRRPINAQQSELSLCVSSCRPSARSKEFGGDLHAKRL